MSVLKAYFRVSFKNTLGDWFCFVKKVNNFVVAVNLSTSMELAIWFCSLRNAQLWNLHLLFNCLTDLFRILYL